MFSPSLSLSSRLQFFCLLSLACLLFSNPAAAGKQSIGDIKARISIFEQGLQADEDDVWAELEQMAPLLQQAPAALISRHQRLMCWYFEGDTADALAFANRHLSAARQTGDLRAETDFQLCRGSFQFQLDQYPAAKRDFTEALENALLLQDNVLIAHAASYRGKLHGTTGQVALALADFMTAQRYFEHENSSYWKYENLMWLANTYRRLGDQTKALEIYHALQSAPNFSDSEMIMVQLYQQMGSAYEDLGEMDKALTSYQYAEQLTEQLEDPYEIALNNLFIGGLLSEIGRNREALKHLDGSSHPELNRDAARVAMRNTYAAKAWLGLGQTRRALDSISRAAKFNQTHQNSRFAVHQSRLHAEILAASGNWQTAYAKLTQHVEAKLALDKQALKQQGLRVKEEFELERAESDKRRKLAEKQLTQKFQQAREDVENWRKATIGLAIMMLVLIAAQLRRHKAARIVHRR